ncbi:MAG: YgeY family selenium metabolism-linked hydrolase [Candidatus Baldrarchaeia archaeon]
MKKNSDVLNFVISLVKTPSLPGQEEKVAKLVYDEMKKLEYDDVFTDELGSVIGIINSKRGKTLCFNGHMDHVPEGDPNNWKYPPYSATIEGNNLYGRATVDMKSALASMIYAAAKARDKGMLDGKIVVTAVVFEELQEGFAMKNIVENHNIDPDIVVLGEPTNLNLAIGHRGRAEIEITVYGKTSHASMPELGDNAVFKALPLLQVLKNINKEMPEHPVLGKETLALTKIVSEPPEGPIIPDKCRIFLDRRISVLSKKEEILRETQKILDSISDKLSKDDVKYKIIETELKCYTGCTLKAERFFYKWVLDKEDPLVKKSIKALEEAGLTPEIIIWRFGTDGSYTAGEKGIPTIGFGPGDEHLAHQPNEHISIKDINKAINGYISLTKNLLEK